MSVALDTPGGSSPKKRSMKSPTGGATDGSGTRRVKPKNQDRFNLRRLLRVLKNHGDEADPSEVIRLAASARRSIRRSDRKGTFNARDARIARRTARELGQENFGLVMDPFADAAAKRLRRTAVRAAPGILGPQDKDPFLRLGHNPRGGKKGGRGRRLGRPGFPGRGRGPGGPGGGNAKGIRYNAQSYRDNPRLVNVARQMVNADTNNQLQDIRRVMQSLIRGGNHDARDIRTLGRRTRGDLNNIFGEVTDYLGANKAAISGEYGDLIDRVTQGNANTSAANAAGTGENLGALNAELARLGIDSAGTGNFNSEAGFSAQMADTNNRDLMNNIQMQRTGAGAVGDMLQGTMRGERVSQIGQAWNNQTDALNDNRDRTRDMLGDLRQQALDTRKDRGGLIQQLLLQLQDRDYNRWAEQSQNNFMNQMQANAFNLDVDQLNSSNQWNRMQLLQQQAATRMLNRQKKAQLAGNSIMNQISSMFPS